jgi:polar amino acid transport system substrate-binding protein
MPNQESLMQRRAVVLPLLLLALAGLAAAAPALAGDAPALVSAGKLTYGVAASFAPFEYQEDGRDTGFDIDFGAAVAAQMGLKPVPMNIDFNGLIPALQGGRIDVVNSAMYINPQRAAQVDFVPYMRIGEEILVRKGNPLKIGSREDLCGHRVAVTLGAIEETYARQDAVKCKAAGRPELDVMTLPTSQDSALSLRQGRADAVFDSTPGAAVLAASMPDVYEVAGEPFDAGTEIGIAVRKGDAAMRVAVEQAVHAIVADGTYARLLSKYRLPPSGSLF